MDGVGKKEGNTVGIQSHKHGPRTVGDKSVDILERIGTYGPVSRIFFRYTNYINGVGLLA